MEAWTCTSYPSWLLLIPPALLGLAVAYGAMHLRQRPRGWRALSDRERRQLPPASLPLRISAALLGQTMPAAVIFLIFQPAGMEVSAGGLEVRYGVTRRHLSWSDVTRARVVDAAAPEYRSMRLLHRVERGPLRGGLNSRSVNTWLLLAGAERALALEAGARLRYVLAPPDGQWEAFWRAISPYLAGRLVSGPAEAPADGPGAGQ